MLYLTVSEFAEYLRSQETVDQSNEESDVIADTDFLQKALESASAELESRLGSRYPLPLPLSPLVKRLCYPIAHWEAEKQGSKRDYVQVEYDRALALIKEILDGLAVLTGIDGKPVPPIGSGDSSPLPGLQSVGTFVGQRPVDWRA